MLSLIESPFGALSFNIFVIFLLFLVLCIFFYIPDFFPDYFEFGNKIINKKKYMKFFDYELLDGSFLIIIFLQIFLQIIKCIVNQIIYFIRNLKHKSIVKFFVIYIFSIPLFMFKIER